MVSAEYAILLALIAVGIIAAAVVLAVTISSLFSSGTTGVSGA